MVAPVSRLLVLSLALVVPALAAMGEPVAPGRSVTGTLDSVTAGTHEHRLDVAAPGWITVSLEAWDFDAALALVEPDGDRLAAEQDGGVYTNAWLQFDAPTAGAWRLEVSAADGRSGDYELSAFAGRVEPPDLDQTEAYVVYMSAAADRALDEGRERRAREVVGRLQARGNELFQTGAAGAEPIFAASRRVAAALGDVRRESIALLMLGELLRQRGEPVEACALLKQGLDGLDEDNDAQLVVFGCDNLGNALLDMSAPVGDAVESYRRFERIALAIGDDALTARARSRLGRAYEVWGDHDQAASLHHGAVELATTAGNAYYLGLICKDAGNYYQRRGRYPRAQQLYEQALPHLDSWMRLVETAGELASVHLAQGRYLPARGLLEEIQQVIEEQGATRYAAGLLSRRAQVAFETGDFAEAASLLEAALEVADDDERPKLEVNLGIVQQQLGDAGPARSSYEQALALCRGHPDRERIECQARINLARLLVASGEASTAVEELYKAHRTARSIEDTSIESAVLGNLALAHLVLGDGERARSQAEAAHALAAERGEVAMDLFALDVLARVALTEGDLDRVEQALVEAEGLLERKDVRQLDSLEAAGARSHHADWAAVAQDLVARRIAAAGDADERAAIALAGLQSAGRWKARALLESMGAAAVPVEAELDLAALGSLLGDDRGLVEYAMGGEHLYAYSLLAGRLEFHDLGDARDLAGQLGGYLSGLTGEPTGTGLADAATLARQGHALFTRLIAPLWKGPQGPGAADPLPAGLVVVPDPELARLPFEALVVEAAEEVDAFDDVTFLTDRSLVTYAPSVRVLLALAAREARPDGRALLVGDPVYADEVEGTGSLVAGLGRIEWTHSEVLDVAALLTEDDEQQPLSELREQRSGSLVTAGFDLYLGSDAASNVVSALADRGKTYSTLHFAVHGLVDARDPRRSGLVLSFEEPSEGLVSLSDIHGLELDADLVVISACLSARGLTIKGEGVQSVARAFLQSGCRSVVASLWSVSDLASREMMTAFARSRAQPGVSAAQALHEARQQLRRRKAASAAAGTRGDRLGSAPSSADYEHPFYWAPFIYVGADF